MNRLLLTTISWLFISSALLAEECVEVYKKNVLHRFVSSDSGLNHFFREEFAKWENETFEVFDRVKNPNAIAIDLGAWIGTTAIWLSHHFHHVIVVEPDRVSLRDLKKNLTASECSNVSICSRPVASTGRTVVFGPRGNQLNESISYIKQQGGHAEDYPIQAITIKQLVHDYIFQNDSISSRDVAFIKCDIEGGEEDILEDLLYFAYYNKTKVYLSFHLEWWKSKKITDFKHLFEFFKTDCPSPDLCDYLSHHPFASVLLEPQENSEVLIKTQMPAVIIAYNQPTFVKNMVRQLEPYTSDIIIIDNNSTFPSMLDYYENEYQYTLLKQKNNFGFTVYKKDWIQKLVGDVYLLTDPDLEFNENLPTNFIQQMLEVSDYFQAHRVGFALSIDHPDLRPDVCYHGKTIQSWEANAWNDPVRYDPNPDLEVYRVDIDTTFCLINKKHLRSAQHTNLLEYPENSSYRIAGDFTCKHLPWHKNFHLMLEEGEYESYLQGHPTSWFRLSESEKLQTEQQ